MHWVLKIPEIIERKASTMWLLINPVTHGTSMLLIASRAIHHIDTPSIMND